MKILRIAILVFGPLLGVAIGDLVGVLLVGRAEHNIAPDMRGPGDGMLPVLTAGIGFGSFLWASLVLATRMAKH